MNSLQGKLTRSASALKTAHEKIEKLIGESGFWEGDAAVAFREALDGDLPKYLKDAHTSVEKAATQLGRWHTGLTSRRDLAKKYDTEAADHKGDLKTAQGKHDKAKANPDLKLAGKTFNSHAELDAAQSRLDAANNQLKTATSAVNKAQGALDAVIKKAKELESQHSEQARKIAQELKDSTKDLAPEEPGWLSKAMGWIGDHLTDILSVAAAVAGLLALICTGPFGVAFLLAAAALSAATAASRLSDPEVLASLKDGFTKGEFDADFWSNAVGFAGDALGVVPGAGAAARGLNGAVQSTRFASESVTVGQFLGRFADDTVTAAGRIATAGAANPVGDLVARAAGGNQGVRVAMDYVSPVAGAVTSGSGLVAGDSDGVKNTGTGVDAGRAALFDGPGAIDTIVQNGRLVFR
ncbi:membrane protein [Streptomyces daqingensis]|uniref:Membrane protein n=1 Tax=Streptomyces daqingensis TaxID=1472640 RepID=A0ABQ2MXK8_9ACTN|nr:hypothetical protein [Streptomyces daqingensis]GGO57848.1 membrane protein [Streptomyces daqingensis]